MIKNAWKSLVLVGFCVGLAAASQNSAAQIPGKPGQNDCGGGPVDDTTTLSQARKFLRQGNAAKALIIANGEVTADPTDYDAKVVQATALNATGKPKEAMKIVEEVLQKQPENDDALLLKGIIQLREKQFPEAAETFAKVIDRSPRYCDAHTLLAQTQIRLKDTTSARLTVEKADPCCADDGELAKVKKQLDKQSKK